MTKETAPERLTEIAHLLEIRERTARLSHHGAIADDMACCLATWTDARLCELVPQEATP